MSRMRNATLIAGVVIIGGCVSAPPPIPNRYQLGVPEAMAGDVYIRNDLKSSFDGNTYVIRYHAPTSTCSTVTNSPVVQEADAELATNRWPVRRSHIDLSIDGGSTWPRRIGYGVQRDPDGLGGEFIWSPPEDYSLMTTNARLRITNLDGLPFDTPAHTNHPWDTPSGQYVMSWPFRIVGLTVSSPREGDFMYATAPFDIAWTQCCAGATVRVYWVTTETLANWPRQLVATFSNCVDGVNQRTLFCNIPPAPVVRLYFVSGTDPHISNYSVPFEVVE